MIKKFNLFKESASDIEQLKHDVEYSLLDLCDELGYKMDDTLAIYTIDEYISKKSGGINGHMSGCFQWPDGVRFPLYANKTDIIININPKYINIMDSNSDNLDYVHEINEHRYRTIDILKNALDRFEGDKYFYEKEKWNWFIFLGK